MPHSTTRLTKRYIDSLNCEPGKAASLYWDSIDGEYLPRLLLHFWRLRWRNNITDQFENFPLYVTPLPRR
jgi:hypothetical protein